MSSPTSAVTGSSSGATTEVAASSSTANGSSSTVSMSTTASTMSELKQNAPQVYNAMMLGIATQICNDAENRQDAINEMIRESEND